MAFFDKLKDLKQTLNEAKQTFDEVKQGIKIGLMSEDDRIALEEEKRIAAINELPEESSLTYTLCKDFSVDEIEGLPGKFKITEHIGFSIKGNIEIPAEIDGKQIYSIGEGLFQNCKELEYVKLANGIEIIEHSAFRESSLKGIVLPESLKKICDRAFMKSGLQRINLPDDVEFIGRACFCKCTELLTAKLPANKKSLPDYLFYGCKQLSDVTIPDNLISVGHDACVPCPAIPETLELLGNNGLILPHSVEFHFPDKLRRVHGELFKNINCEKLFVPANLTFVQPEYYSCNDVNLEEREPFVDENETGLDNDSGNLCFAGAGYKEVTFSPGSNYSLRHVDGPFRDCQNLEKLYIPHTMTEFDQFDGLFGVHKTHSYFVGVKDQYGRAVLNHDGSQVGEFKGKDSCTILPPPNANFKLYCEAGSEALRFAKKFEIPCEEWVI